MIHTHPPQYWTINDWDSIPENLRGKTIQLVHIDDVINIQIGDQLVDVLGKVAIAGKDEIDMDTRGGYIAYGYLVE